MFEQVKSIISSYTEQKDITPESSLTSDLGLSSFDLVTIVAAFEDTFDIEVPDRAITRFVTVQDIMDYLEENT